MGAAAVLLFAVPSSPLAQPWAVIGGNTLSAFAGIAVLRLWRSAGLRFPVLMLTAKQLSPEEAQLYGMYIEDYVLKPITHRELYDTIEHVLKRRSTIKLDIEEAKKAGFDQKLIDEYSRLAKSVDVNTRLLKILETTYNIHDTNQQVSSKISQAMKSMSESIKVQEDRLQHLRTELTKVLNDK